MRKKRVYKKFHEPDIQHERIDVARFINYVMRDGKKSTAERIVYGAFDRVKEITKEEPVKVFEKALENAAPVLEVKSRRVGGANYQVPIEVRPERRFVLAVRWIIGAARKRKGKGMAEKLADEIISASKTKARPLRKNRICIAWPRRTGHLRILPDKCDRLRERRHPAIVSLCMENQKTNYRKISPNLKWARLLNTLTQSLISLLKDKARWTKRSIKITQSSENSEVRLIISLTLFLMSCA